MVGKTVTHYKILKKLGAGSMGSVYQALDLKLDRVVALKFLNKDLLLDEEARVRFVNEAKIISTIEHPNIATIYEIDEIHDSFFISMGYYEGKTLREHLANGPLSVDETYSITIQIADGLSEAHKAGVIHRDIKPANIIIGASRQVKILDFGVAKARQFAEITRSHTPIGTVAYMSPEQAAGGRVDYRSDIFSVGVILYEMLAGERPFEGDYDLVVLYSILHDDPKSLRDCRPDLPGPLENLVLKALAKEPSDRYQTADELRDDLRAGQGGRANISPPAKPRLRTSFSLSLTGRRWMALGSVAVFVLIFLLLFIMRPFGESRGQIHSIAVMPFSYEGEEDDWRWLSAAATDLINSELERYPSVQVLRAQKRLQVMRKLGIESEKLDRSSALKIASAANMSSVLVGGLRKQGDSIRLQGQILATDTGKLIEELEPVEDEHIRLHELAGTFSSRLVKWMKVEIPSESRANRPGTRAPVSLDALRYYIEGRDAAYDLRYAEGIAKLSKAISLDSTFIRPYYLLAWQYESIGNKAKAKEVLTRGKPHIANLPLDKRLEYLCQEANIEDRWQDYANYLEQLLRLRPGKASLHFRYGMTQYTHFRNVDAGIAAMQKSLQLDSTYSYAYNALGYAYLARGDKKKAVEMLQKYVALKPSGVNPLESLAEIFELIGRYDEAIALCQRIKALQPDFPYLPIRLARVYISLGRYARALEVLDESVPQSPKFESIAQSLRAELYFRRDEFEKALVFALQAITLDPGNLDGHWMHGRILLRLGKEEAFKKELALLRRAVEKKRSLKNRWLLDHLEGEYAHQRDDFGRAIESFQSALGLMPLDRSFYRAALANAYVKSGQLNKAVAQYKLATRFNPNAAQACFELARTYEHLGNLSKASRYYKKVLDIWSDADKEIKQLVATKKKIATFELSSKER